MARRRAQVVPARKCDTMSLMTNLPNLSARRVELAVMAAMPCHDLNLFHGHALKCQGIPTDHQNVALASLLAQGLVAVDDHGIAHLTETGDRLRVLIYGDASPVVPSLSDDPSMIESDAHEVLVRRYGDATIADVWDVDSWGVEHWDVLAPAVDAAWRAVLPSMDGSRFTGQAGTGLPMPGMV